MATMVAIGALAKCGGGDGLVAPVADASPDRWKAKDAWPDVGSQEDADASVLECTPEGGVSHDFPGYTRLDALDPCCKVDVPDDLSTVPAMQWEACTTGRTDCQEFKITWTNPDSPERFAFGRRYDSGKGPASFEVAIWRGDSEVEDLVYDYQTAAPLKSWRSDRTARCFVTSASNSSVVVPIALVRDDPFRIAITPRDAGAGLDASFLTIPTSIVSNTEAIQTYALSDTTIALSASPSGAIAVGPPGGPYARTTSSTQFLIYPMAYGDLVLALAEHGNAGWAQIDKVGLDGSVSVFITKPNTHVSAVATDGNRIYWMEASGGTTYLDPSTKVEAWSAPLTSDATALASTATKLATLPIGSVTPDAIAFDGYYAIRLSPNVAAVVRPSDGALRTVAVTPNRRFGGIANVTPNEIWIVEDGMKSGESGLALVRLAYAAW